MLSVLSFFNTCKTHQKIPNVPNDQISPNAIPAFSPHGDIQTTLVDKARKLQVAQVPKTSLNYRFCIFIRRYLIIEN